MFISNVAYLVCFIFWVDGAVIPSPCIQERTCFLPQCRCQNSGIPEHLSPNEIPQMVILTFEGPITEDVYQNSKMLMQGKNNPNGCPISGTMFVSSNNTVFSRVRSLYETGLEIGLLSSGKPHQSWASKLLTRKEFSILAALPLHEIRGWRETDPHSSEPSAKEMQILSETGFEYGSTVADDQTNGRDGHLDFFPYTHVPNIKTLCTTEQCRSSGNLWQIDMNSNYKFSVLPDRNPCREDMSLKVEFMNYLFRTFTQHYRNRRSPMVLNLPTFCLTSLPLLVTLDNFLQTVTKFHDTFVVSVHQAIQWTQHPHKINSILDFDPWQRSCRSISHLLNSTDKSAVTLLNRKAVNNSDSERKDNSWESLQNRLLEHALDNAVMSRRDRVLELYQSNTFRSPSRTLIFVVIGAIVLLFVILAVVVFFVQKLSSKKCKSMPHKVTYDAMYECYGGSPA